MARVNLEGVRGEPALKATKREPSVGTWSESRPVYQYEVTVLIPTLNEAEAIGTVLHEVKNAGYTKILVVDGYSNDGTVDLVEENGVRLLYQHGAGKAGALKTGMEYVDTPYVLVMDGDSTYDPRDAVKMLPHAKKYDMIIGVRSPENIPRLHRLGNRIINSAFNLLLGAGLSDVCSGMYLLRTQAFRELNLTSKGFSVEIAVATGVFATGRVTEVPISYRKRIGKRKLKTWQAGFGILSTLVGLAWSYNPVFLFAILASLLAIPGIGITLWELYLRWIYGSAAWSTGMVWLGLFLLIIGVQGFTIATITLLLKRMERRILQRVGREEPRA
jgi:glycosyltransferase involved in cell wall biosynthesis